MFPDQPSARFQRILTACRLLFPDKYQETEVKWVILFCISWLGNWSPAGPKGQPKQPIHNAVGGDEITDLEREACPEGCGGLDGRSHLAERSRRIEPGTSPDRARRRLVRDEIPATPHVAVADAVCDL